MLEAYFFQAALLALVSMRTEIRGGAVSVHGSVRAWVASFNAQDKTRIEKY